MNLKQNINETGKLLGLAGLFFSPTAQPANPEFKDLSFLNNETALTRSIDPANLRTLEAMG